MEFIFINTLLFSLCLIFFFIFRFEVFTYCRLHKIRKRDIRKKMKGAKNYWFYSQLHKENIIGKLYYINLVFTISLILFLIMIPFSFASFLKIPIAALGFILSITSIPALWSSIFIENKDRFGKPFVIFKTYRLTSGKLRFATFFEWVIALLPLTIYIIFIYSK